MGSRGGAHILREKAAEVAQAFARGLSIRAIVRETGVPETQLVQMRQVWQRDPNGFLAHYPDAVPVEPVVTIDGAFIPLRSGERVLIDPADVALVRGYGWYIHLRDEEDGSPDVRAEVKGTSITLVSLLMQPLKGFFVQHQDGDYLNCQRANLIVRSRAVIRNRGRMNANNTSGYKGVYWHKQGQYWYAAFNHTDASGKNRQEVIQRLGRTDADRHRAAIAYNQRMREFYGLDAFQNTIEEDAEIYPRPRI